MKISKLTYFFVVLVVGLSFAFRTNDSLCKEKAIKLAEQYIIDNGYTKVPANKSKISYELFESKNNVDDILKNRHNTLQPKAFCISEGKDRWDVGFVSVDVDLVELDSMQRQTDLPGRVVIVMKNHREVRIAHKDPLFSHFKKL